MKQIDFNITNQTDGVLIGVMIVDNSKQTNKMAKRVRNVRNKSPKLWDFVVEFAQDKNVFETIPTVDRIAEKLGFTQRFVPNQNTKVNNNIEIIINYLDDVEEELDWFLSKI